MLNPIIVDFFLENCSTTIVLLMNVLIPLILGG